MADGVFPSKNGYHYILKGRKSTFTHKDKSVVAKKYIEHMVEVLPKYKPLFAGKTWPQIFKIAGIHVDR